MTSHSPLPVGALGYTRAAFIRDENDDPQKLEQKEFIGCLNEERTENPHQIDPEGTFGKMVREREIRISGYER